MLADQYKQKIKLEKSMEIIQENYAVRINIAKVLEEEFKNDDSVDVDSSSGVMTLKENAIEFYPDKSTLKSNPEYIDNICSMFYLSTQRPLLDSVVNKLIASSLVISILSVFIIPKASDGI